MKTLFGIRSNIATVLVATCYIIISLNTSINGVNKFKEFRSEYHEPTNYLFINTKTNFFHISTLFLSFCCLFSSILLILGITEKRYKILLPWMIVNLIFEILLIGLVLYLFKILYEVFNTNWWSTSGVILAIFINIIAVVFHDYIRNGVYHLYIQFRKESSRLYRVIDGEDERELLSV